MRDRKGNGNLGESVQSENYENIKLLNDIAWNI